jgi:hypothetical protein
MKKRFSTIEDDETLIPLKAGASLIGLSPDTIRLGKAGTEGLTKIRQGNKLFLIKAEVLAHRRNLIDAARRTREMLKECYPAS